MRWVSKDGRSLADRVFFLGWPSNFAVDASRISGDAVSGGCAYFVYKDLEAIPNQPFYVFRYNMVNGKAKFVEQLPQGWDDMCTWLFPRPSIAPIQVYMYAPTSNEILVPNHSSNFYKLYILQS
jgi:hypothetical protein